MLLLKSFPFVSFLIFSTLIYMPTTVVTTYAAYMFEAIGENTNLVGLLIGLRTVMEAPGMLLHSRMRRKYKVSAIMLLAAALYVVEMALSQFAGSATGCYCPESCAMPPLWPRNPCAPPPRRCAMWFATRWPGCCWAWWADG